MFCSKRINYHFSCLSDYLNLESVLKTYNENYYPILNVLSLHFNMAKTIKEPLNKPFHIPPPVRPAQITETHVFDVK